MRLNTKARKKIMGTGRCDPQNVGWAENIDILLFCLTYWKTRLILSVSERVYSYDEYALGSDIL
jgi:hypothetical protein